MEINVYDRFVNLAFSK